MNELIQTLKSQGYKVYAPEKISSYVFFTDGVNIGAVQIDRLEGIKYCTVHKASSEHGTGYHVNNAYEALNVIVPSWGRRDCFPPIKYKNIEEFISKSWQKLIQY